MALDVSKRDEGCSAFEDPFWCWLRLGATLYLGSWSYHLREIQLPKEMGCVLAVFIEVLHALVFAPPARGAQCLNRGPGTPLLQPFSS